MRSVSGTNGALKAVRGKLRVPRAVPGRELGEEEERVNLIWPCSSIRTVRRFQS